MPFNTGISWSVLIPYPGPKNLLRYQVRALRMINKIKVSSLLIIFNLQNASELGVPNFDITNNSHLLFLGSEDKY